MSSFHTQGVYLVHHSLVAFLGSLWKWHVCITPHFSSCLSVHRTFSSIPDASWDSVSSTCQLNHLFFRYVPSATQPIHHIPSITLSPLIPLVRSSPWDVLTSLFHLIPLLWVLIHFLHFILFQCFCLLLCRSFGLSSFSFSELLRCLALFSVNLSIAPGTLSSLDW